MLNVYAIILLLLSFALIIPCSAQHRTLWQPVRCKAGTHLDSMRQHCVSCDAGYYMPISMHTFTNCFVCPEDTYNPKTGAVSCIKCPPKHITIQPAALECYDCTKNTTALNSDITTRCKHTVEKHSKHSVFSLDYITAIALACVIATSYVPVVLLWIWDVYISALLCFYSDSETI